MNDAIKRYERAEAELKEASAELQRVVNPHFIKASDAKDIHRIMRIIELMPRTFTPSRRMYERIYRIEDGQ